MLGDAADAAIYTIFGCVGCVAGMERLKREIDGSANLITVSCFVFIVSEDLLSRQLLGKTRKIPLREYMKLSFLFYLVNLANNVALDMDVSYPVFIIYKSASLPANLLLGFLLRRQYYSSHQVFSVVMVTLGVCLFTVSSGDTPRWARPPAAPPIQLSDDVSVSPYAIGVSLLTGALLLSAYLGICQEELYRTYGPQHSNEVMLYVHLFSLPYFLLQRQELAEGAVAAWSSPGLFFPWAPPRALLLIGLICILNWLCVASVYRLTSLTTSLNVTMLLTLRKFLSLFISVYFFENIFSFFHLMGMFFVFVGSALFSFQLF